MSLELAATSSLGEATSAPRFVRCDCEKLRQEMESSLVADGATRAMKKTRLFRVYFFGIILHSYMTIMINHYDPY